MNPRIKYARSLVVHFKYMHVHVHTLIKGVVSEEAPPGLFPSVGPPLGLKPTTLLLPIWFMHVCLYAVNA